MAKIVGTYLGKDVNTMTKQELIAALKHVSELYADALKERGEKW